MECAYEEAARQWECCSASVVMGSLALNFVSFPWLRVLSSWPDQLPGFHMSFAGWMGLLRTVLSPHVALIQSN